MSQDEKSRLRGEAYTIMASRYFDAFRNFGGLCLVKKAYAVGENFTEGRSTAWQTVEFIDSLIQCAIDEPGFIWNIPNADVGQWSGRLTRASARALRAKVWMFAASPLFNSSEPYMTYDKRPTGLEKEEHVWFGKEDPTLWNRCLQYCNDFFNDRCDLFNDRLCDLFSGRFGDLFNDRFGDLFNDRLCDLFNDWFGDLFNDRFRSHDFF